MRRLVLSLVAPLFVACASSPAPEAQTPAPAAVPAAGAPAAAAPASKKADPTQEANEKFAKISIDQLATKLQAKEKLAVFDANTKERFAQGHIPGAKWIDSMAVKAADLPEDKSVPLVFYCGNEQCKASHRAANVATELGHSSVAVLPAGILGWEKAGRPTEK
jgi:rhodanese-related sulfurtransferase